MNRFKITRITTGQSRRQDVVDNMHRGLRRLAKILPVIATPILEDRRLTETDEPLIGMELDDNVYPDGRRQTSPLMNTAGRETNRNGFYRRDLHAAQPTFKSASAGVESDNNLQPRSVTQNMSLFCMPKRPGI